jgi:predicted alpha/beta-hydrolase family hydrolase
MGASAYPDAGDRPGHTGGVPGKALEIPTPRGPARAHLDLAAGASAALVLGHGAGGGVEAPDILAAADAAGEAGLSVARVEQPYRVAGRRSPAPAGQLDEAWVTVVTALAEGALDGLRLIVGGRSAGARVACRTSAELGAAAVLCLAFPVHPPGRGDDPSKSRLGELDAVPVPVLVVQGESDPFGMPPDAPGRTVVRISGNHSLRDGAAVSAAVSAWLEDVAITRAPT